MSIKRFIVLEGVDLVGKSTTAKLLSQALDAARVVTPSDIFTSCRIQVEKFGSPTLRFLFYLTTVVEASEVVRKLMSQHDVVCDRYIYSTLAYHSAMGVDISVCDYSRLNLVIPTHTFYLRLTSDEERKRRLVKRGINLHDNLLEQNQIFQQKVHAAYMQYPMSQILIDGLTEDEVVSRVVALL